MKYGKKNWVFCDGDLPPAGDNPDFQGHSIYSAYIELSIICNINT